MATIRKTVDTRPDAAAIVSRGAHVILDRCASHDEVFPKVTAAFFDSIRDLAGHDVEAATRRDGLRMLHAHFPTEKVLLLEEAVRQRLKETLYYWSYLVGRDDLKLEHPFYVDHLIVIRIHFPYRVARKAKAAAQPPSSRADLGDHLAAALGNPRILVNQASRALRRPRKNSAYEPDAFHGSLTKPARSHGAHIDTWYGHSFDGINLWWSIDGVTVDNTVILYPDMFGRPIEFDPKSMYLAPGQQVSEPHQVDLAPGQLLLFNPEMLHSTQVNVSDFTRVALTTRVNPHRPRFNDEAPFNFEHWHSSRDLERRRFRSMDVFPAGKNRGAPSHEARPRLDRQKSDAIKVGAAVGSGPACAASLVKPGSKLAIDFADAKVMVFRDAATGALKAYSRACPHVGVDLIDGWHDDKEAHCPGHGLRFRWRDGESNCEGMRLKSFIVVERDGYIHVSRKSAPALEAETMEA